MQAGEAVTLVRPLPKTSQARPSAGLGKEEGAVVGEGVGEAGGGVGGDDAEGCAVAGGSKGVDAGAVLRFTPAGGGLAAEAEADLRRGLMRQVSSRKAEAKRVRQPSSVMSGA